MVFTHTNSKETKTLFRVRDFLKNTSFTFDDSLDANSLFSSKQEENSLLNFLSYLTTLSEQDIRKSFFSIRWLDCVPKIGRYERISFMVNYFFDNEFLFYRDNIVNNLALAELPQKLLDFTFIPSSPPFFLRRVAYSNKGVFFNFYKFLEEYFFKWFSFFEGYSKEPPIFIYSSLLNTIIQDCLNEEKFLIYLECGGIENSFMAIDMFIDYVIDSYFVFSANNGKIFVEIKRFAFSEVSSEPFYNNGVITPIIRQDIKKSLKPIFQGYDNKKIK